jgi:hypothetical protein
MEPSPDIADLFNPRAYVKNDPKPLLLYMEEYGL